MSVSTDLLIGARQVAGTNGAIHATNPATGAILEPAFGGATLEQLEQACALAWQGFDAYRDTTLEERAAFLEQIAVNILAIGDALIERCMEESGLPRARLEGERGRTVGQLRLFAAVVRAGDFLDLRVDPAQPARQPLPRVDLRMRQIPLGPVAVFGASNFPLAFSVAGGDTASALAAGCPVVLKAHSAHPGTSELVARAIVNAIAICQLPAGVFALLTGTGNGIGQTLVAHPAIQAVGFTGSRSGGIALMKVAAERVQPIPVYAEMSSINPVFVLPQALAARGAAIASGFAASLTMGVGQFCTNPGLVLGLEGPDFTAFAAAAAEALAPAPAATMLTAGIASSYAKGVAALAQHADVTPLVHNTGEEGKGAAALFVTSGEAFLARHDLRDEVFGPASLLVACRDMEQLLAITESLEGQLTATLQMDAGDVIDARRLLPVLERRVGRILANGFPTGVEVSTAMVHGGPFPATSDGRSTSVGTAAINRFLRPVSYQNLLQDLLPESLRDGNPLGIWRRKDGVLGKE